MQEAGIPAESITGAARGAKVRGNPEFQFEGGAGIEEPGQPGFDHRESRKVRDPGQLGNPTEPAPPEERRFGATRRFNRWRSWKVQKSGIPEDSPGGDAGSARI